MHRIRAVVIKDFLQLRRDRITAALAIIAPLFQILLYGYAVNTTPRHMPSALILQEHSDIERSIVRALENTAFFQFTHIIHDEKELDPLLSSGAVLFAIEIPAGFERAVRRGDVPTLLVIADSTDPIAANAGIGAVEPAMKGALKFDRGLGDDTNALYAVRIHQRYNPANSNAFNVVPGLVGTILTMTMISFTAISMTRETEKNTLELLLKMPLAPYEIMAGKFIPYIAVGVAQASIIIGIGMSVFGVPLYGSIFSLVEVSFLFIMTNLALGLIAATFASTQMQAIQICSLIVLPNMLLSGFLFPYTGMPQWAQQIGEFLPLTHYLRMMRSIMLKGADLTDLSRDVFILVVMLLLFCILAIVRARTKLD